MKIKIDNLNINYIQYGEGSDILLLHGWGQNIEMMKFLGDNFADNHRITILDFPGFGESDEPLSPWTIKDYSLLIEKLVKELDIKKPVVMGHSFGGRVAIYYSSNNPIEKLVLFGSPCIRKDKELPLSVKILKGIKKLPSFLSMSYNESLLVKYSNKIIVLNQRDNELLKKYYMILPELEWM